MYRHSYAEILDDAASEGRARERMAFDHAIELMQAAEAKGVDSREAVEAIFFLNRLWSLLIEDLASDENGLPKELRASLISIGLWVLREAQRLRQEMAGSFAALIEVNSAIRNGLA
ncbi:Flagellar biosynthesis regulator FlaF [Chelatococcus sambhunathii]|uniref:Flagellar biosynthesis regulator FlhF n=2 Tax=Chelatococcus TaxID=28209 RepID=A0AAC9JTP7_9HYPH|nr:MULTISPECIES: flagellar biosynthesis regulator FlaF [Chelatococcus]APF38455.1 flagellar biosynthesis regulator FlhF [Chelatococcus daeguensis]CUA85108.1 Flagellar biosynthesis regulator FlaF [Chelatococcus sambhunathii]